MEIKDEQQYMKGVNHAYTLAEHQPSLLKKLLEVKKQNDYFIGLHDGQRIYEQEQSKSRLKELREISKKKSKNRDLER
jgi:hypothetical protein